MMKALLKGRREPGKATAVSSVVFNAGDVKLRACLTDSSVTNGPSLNGLSLSVDKPGSLLIDYDLPKQDVRFQFMNTVRVLDKPLNLTYTHWRGENRTALDGTVVFDSANKVSANYAFDSGNCKLKYSYVHGGSSTFEPSYDFAKNSLDFVVLKRLDDDDVVRASYQTSTRVLLLEWTRSSAFCGKVKFSASLNLAKKSKVPKLCAESTWNIDM